MATRKQKKKRLKKQRINLAGRSASVIDQPPEKQVEELKISLKNHRVRRALAIAKSLAKQSPIPADALPLIINAYEMRIFEMVKDEHIAEALQFYSLLQTDHPQWKEQFSTDVIVCLECFGAKPQLLPRYETDEESRKNIDSYIRQHLLDPSVLANHPSLPESHVLRQEAKVVLAVWERIENGETLDIRNELRGISRRSPFNYWRVFLHALNDFYTNDDSNALATMSRIPKDSALHSLVPVFRDLIARRPPDRDVRDPLFVRIYQNDPVYLLNQLEKTMTDKNKKLVEENIISVYEKLRENQPVLLVLDCISNILVRLEDEDYLSPMRLAKRLDHKHKQAILLRLNYYFKRDGVAEWDQYIKSNRGRLSKVELSLIYHHQGQLSGYQYQDEGRNYRLKYNKRPTKQLQKTVDHYYKLSIKTLPTEKCYEDWLKEYTLFDWNPSSIQKQWHQDFPENEDVLFSLLQQARKKRAVKQVDTYFEKLKLLLHNSPRLLEITPFVKLEKCIHALKSNPPLEDLDRIFADLPASPKLIAVCRDTIYWLRQGCPPDKNHPIVSKLEGYQSPYLILVCLQKIEPTRFDYRRLPDCIERQFKDPNMVVRDLCDAYKGNFNHWFVSQLPQNEQVKKALANRSLEPNLILEFLSLLRVQCPSLNENSITELVLQLTANGLKRTDVPTADMLCYRAMIYYSFQTEKNEFRHVRVERTEELLSAAKYSLKRGKGNEQLFNETVQFVPEYSSEQDRETWPKNSMTRLIKRELKIKSVRELKSHFARISGFMPSPIARMMNNMSGRDFENILDEFLDEFGGDNKFDPDDDFESLNPLAPFEPPKRRIYRKPKRPPKAPQKKEKESVDVQPELPNLFD